MTAILYYFNNQEKDEDDDDDDDDPETWHLKGSVGGDGSKLSILLQKKNKANWYSLNVICSLFLSLSVYGCE